MSPPLSSGAASSSSSRVETGIGRHCNCHWAKGEPGDSYCWGTLGTASWSDDEAGAGTVVGRSLSLSGEVEVER